MKIGNATEIWKAAIAQLAALRAQFDALEPTILAAVAEIERAKTEGTEALVSGVDLGVPITSWRSACRRGEIDGARRVGRKYMAPRASVAAWIASREAPKKPAEKALPEADDVDEILNRAIKRGQAA